MFLMVHIFHTYGSESDLDLDYMYWCFYEEFHNLSIKAFFGGLNNVRHFNPFIYETESEEVGKNSVFRGYWLLKMKAYPLHRSKIRSRLEEYLYYTYISTKRSAFYYINIKSNPRSSTILIYSIVHLRVF